MRAYIDTNIYDYVALRHPVYGKACREILSDVYERKLEAYGSILVAIEILGSLAEIDTKIAAGAVNAFLSLPIEMVPIDNRSIEMAASIALETSVSYDSVHASAMAKAGVPTIITEDFEHWSRISTRWMKIRDKMSIEFKEIEVVRPTEYVRWKTKK